MMTKEVMERIVKSCRTSKRTCEATKSLLESGGICEQIYGDLLDAIYLILGENTSTIDESIASTVINSNMTDGECSDVLFTIYQARKVQSNPMPGQPAPIFFTREQQDQMTVGYGS